jgi:hypothetical protein
MLLTNKPIYSQEPHGTFWFKESSLSENDLLTDHEPGAAGGRIKIKTVVSGLTLGDCTESLNIGQK